MTCLRNLSRSLVGGGQPPTPSSPSRLAPLSGGAALASSVSSRPCVVEEFKLTPPPLEGALEYEGEVRSLRSWCQKLGIHDATLRHRLRKGWSVAQALGKEPPPTRDRTLEQLGRHQSKVTIVDNNGREISRRDAAAMLNVNAASLTKRLKNYRQASTVSIDRLKERARK